MKAITQRITQPVVLIVFLTNIVNVLGPILAGHKAIQLYGDAVIGVITAILTLATILFAEIIPKSLGVHYAPVISRLVAPAILVLIYLLYPIVVGLNGCQIS